MIRQVVVSMYYAVQISRGIVGAEQWLGNSRVRIIWTRILRRRNRTVGQKLRPSNENRRLWVAYLFVHQSRRSRCNPFLGLSLLEYGAGWAMLRLLHWVIESKDRFECTSWTWMDAEGRHGWSSERLRRRRGGTTTLVLFSYLVILKITTFTQIARLPR